MRYLSLALVALLSGCATAPVGLAPDATRRKEYSIETALSKDAAFDKLQSWAATSGTVKLADRQSGTVVLRTSVPCDSMKLGNGWGKQQTLHFIVEMKVQDKMVQANFSNLMGISPGAWDSGMRPATNEEVDSTVKECVDPVKLLLASKLK